MTASENSTQPSAAKQRIVKKYPNRRLYDTDTSSYITLAEVRELVIAREPVVVRDAKTGEDLTRSILLQIILEEEAGGAPMFSEPMLANIIRFYGHAMQGHMGNYIEKNVQMFTDFQSKLSEQTGMSGSDAWTKMMSMSNPMVPGGYTEQMQKMQEQMQKQTEQMMAMFGMKR